MNMNTDVNDEEEIKLSFPDIFEVNDVVEVSP